MLERMVFSKAIFASLVLISIQIFVASFDTTLLEGFETAKTVVFKTELDTPAELICKSWVIVTEVEDSFHFSQNDRNSLTTFLNVKKFAKVKYFDKEHTTEELLQPMATGPFRHIPQCQLIFIISDAGPQSFEALTVATADKRLVRLHKDYFIFVGRSDQLRQFMKSYFLTDVRYAYFVAFGEFIDGCSYEASPTARLPSLFQRSCRTVLERKRFIVTSVYQIPWFRFDATNSPSGVYFELLREAQNRNNFTISLQFANSGGASGFKRNGLWFGAVGEIYRRQADIAIGCGLSFNRDGIVDNGFAFNWVSRVFFIKSPQLKTSWRAIFRPFRPTVWLLIGVTAIILAPVYFISLKFWRFVHKQRDSPMQAVAEVVNTLLAVLLDQSASGKTWLGLRIRGLIFGWMFFCLVMGAGYRSRLIYYLTFISPEEVPTTHSGLLDQNYKLLFRYYGGLAYRYAAESRDPVIRAITRRVTMVNSSDDCIVRILLTERTACLDYDTHGTYAIYANATIHVHRQKQIVLISKDTVMSVMVGWIYRKSSPLTESFDTFLTRTMMSGLYAKWQEDDNAESKLNGTRWLSSQVQSPVRDQLFSASQDESSGPTALELSSLSGLYGLLGLGLLLSILIKLLQYSSGLPKRLIRKQTD